MKLAAPYEASSAPRRLAAGLALTVIAALVTQEAAWRRMPVAALSVDPLPASGTSLALPSPAIAATAAPALSPSALDGVMLLGVLRNAAILAEDGVQRRVRIGGSVRPGIVLIALGSDHAIVGRGESRLRLPLARFGATAEAVTVVVDAPIATQPPGPPPKLSRADYDGAAARRQTLAFQLGLEPAKDGETTIGFRVRRVATMPFFKAAGLRDGDIVTAINGNGINDEEKVIELAGELAQSKRVTVSWLRDGSPGESQINFED